jgi:hypothetical protein
MSGDGTYIEVHGGGKYSQGTTTEHHPLTQNPHDPSHYYQGVDGRYYYTPDGNPHPEFGQPPVAKTITPGETPITKPEMNEKWAHEASKGYHMTPESLRNLATALERDLGELQSTVQNNQMDMSAAGAVGQDDWQAGHDFTKLANKAQSDFMYFYNSVITTYGDVISRLRTTANNGQQGEDDTHRSVKAQQTSYNGNPSTDGGNKGV